MRKTSGRRPSDEGAVGSFLHSKSGREKEGKDGVGCVIPSHLGSLNNLWAH
jgi:hypothetical protein